MPTATAGNQSLPLFSAGMASDSLKGKGAFMQRRDGKTWPISSRFRRQTIRKVVEAELDELLMKLRYQAERMGYDLDDEATIDSLLEKYYLRDKPFNFDSATEVDWAEHFLAMAHAQTLIVLHDLDSPSAISALSLGNWVTGILSTMSNTPSPQLCHTCAIKRHASHNGKAGATKRFAPYKALEKWAQEKYLAGNWPSANKAAHALKDEVIAHGRTIGVDLSSENAQRTIAAWLRKKSV